MTETPHPRQHRGTVLSAHGMVAAAHPLAALVGAQVLQSRGNAVDAALAMAAMTGVALPAMCGVGGDAFAVVYDGGSNTWTAYMGSGVGPDGADVAWFVDRGMRALPIDGVLSVAVPGAVDCYRRVHENHATKALDELWAPAVAAARDGIVVSRRMQDEAAANVAKLRLDAVSPTVFLPGGAPPQPGTVLRQPDLAATLEAVARDPSTFYAGELAERCIATLQEQYAPFSGEEWASHQTLVDTPLQTTYGGVTLHTTLPPSPGYMVAQQLQMLDGHLRGRPWLDAAAVDLMAAAARRAFADRDGGVASDTDAWRHLLDGHTTSFVAVDNDGNAVSFIQSIAFTWGSGVMVPGTGVLLNNRAGRGFYLDATHPNRVRPRARPMHTLNAWILAGDDGRPVYVGGTPGGDGQVQWNVQMISHLVDHSLDVQATVEAPRFTVWPGSDADVVGSAPELRCEARLGDATLDQLRARGHDVRRVGPWDGGGGAQLIAVDRKRGTLRGGSDPRVDGCALGI